MKIIHQIPNNVQIGDSVVLGRDVIFYGFANIYGCSIGDECRIGPFVEIQKDAYLGNRVKVQSHAFICSGVDIDDEVFVGHGVMFTNDRFPRSTNVDGSFKTETDWTLEKTHVGRRASIGSNATILCGVSIGENAIVGAGSVVTKDVEAGQVVAGNPARVITENTPV